MRLCRFDAGDGASLGVVEDDGVRDLGAVDPALPTEPAAASAMGIERLEALTRQAPEHALADVRRLRPKAEARVTEREDQREVAKEA